MDHVFPESLSRGIAGLVIDLDGTLIDSDTIYREALAAVGVDATGADFLGARARVKGRLPRGHVCARNRLLYFREMQRADRRLAPREALDRMGRYESELVARARDDWRGSSGDRAMARLAARYPMVVLTNENARAQLLKLSAIDPEGRYFRDLITSEEVGAEKPDPRMLDAALAALGLEPAQTLVVGDDWEADIAPALARGCLAALVGGRLPKGYSAERRRDTPCCIAVDGLEGLCEALGLE